MELSVLSNSIKIDDINLPFTKNIKDVKSKNKYKISAKFFTIYLSNINKNSFQKTYHCENDTFQQLSTM